MTFHIGQTVRVNAGQWYGKLARVTNVVGDCIYVELFCGSRALAFESDALLDSHANNGD